MPGFHLVDEDQESRTQGVEAMGSRFSELQQQAKLRMVANSASAGVTVVQKTQPTSLTLKRCVSGAWNTKVGDRNCGVFFFGSQGAATKTTELFPPDWFTGFPCPYRIVGPIQKTVSGKKR